LKASRAHIFLSKAPFHMILALKFSEFIILSILAFIHNKLFSALYFFVNCVLALGNPAPELLFEDFQEKVFEEPKGFLSEQQGKCP
jgi:hypothetical protein